ncbi:MAG: carbohydrate kinase family protein [Anaerolineales bacterium]|nr:carbohydrate kinase family protein [Anaerolineales bacterium]
MAGPQVLVIGDANVDIVINLPNRTAGTPDLTNSVPRLYGGGSAANVAVALARLGVAVTMVGAVGDDGYGRWVRDDLSHEGVDATGICAIHDAFTPMVMAMVEPDGERLIVVWPPKGGAHIHLTPEAINPAWLASATWLHTSGMCLRDSPVRETILYGMKQARKAGLTVSLDLNMRLELWGLDDETRAVFEQAIALSDVVFGNAAEEIMPITRADSVEAAAQLLCDGQRIVVARQGGQGAIVATPQGTFHAPAFPAQVVDTLGAGDAFDGGFITARLAKMNIEDAARWGNAAAALKIGQSGARSSPSLANLQQLLNGMLQ